MDTYTDEPHDPIENDPTPTDEWGPGFLDRRGFVRLAVATAAASTFGAPRLPAQARVGGRGQAQQAPPPPLGNGEHPAFAFQAYPGGTGAMLEKLARERGRAAFERTAIAVERWTGPVPTAEEDLVFLPMHRLAALVQARRISSAELTNIYLERLKRLDPTLLAAVTIMEGQAREAAQQADTEIRAGRYRGPLHGIPYGIKDLFAVRGVRTTWGSADFENRIIDVDSEVYVRLRDAGAVLIAKLATGLFAQGDNWYRGQTKNPWNVSQGSSGSSAGPGSAVAAGCVAFAIGTETRGSIVSPTNRNGISALRPTFGRVSRYGGMVLAWTMDKVGPMCRTIEDCAIVFNTIHGADEKDASTVTAPFQWERNADLSKFRIGVDETSGVNDGNRAQFGAFLDRLRSLGATLTPIPARPALTYSSALGIESAAAFDEYVVSRGLVEAEAAAGRGAGADSAGGRGAGAGDAGRGRGRGGGGRGRFTGGRDDLALDFIQSQRRRLLIMQQMAEVMKDHDMYITANGDVTLTNETGHPAAVFPFMFREGENPQPMCVTIIGQPFADDKILSVAHRYQKETDWHTRRPRVG
jgi:Asp-tRNA(Asn)/Glu-tRNA(Gln) amidotransferase A subunit family amidase